MSSTNLKKMIMDDKIKEGEPKQITVLPLKEKFTFETFQSPDCVPYVRGIEDFVNSISDMETHNYSFRYILYRMLKRYRVLVTDRMDVFIDMITDDDCDETSKEVAKEHLQMNKEEKESIDDMLFHLGDCDDDIRYSENAQQLRWFLRVVDGWWETIYNGEPPTE